METNRKQNAIEMQRLLADLQSHNINICAFGQKFLSFESFLFELEDGWPKFVNWLNTSGCAANYLHALFNRGLMPLLADDQGIKLFGICSHRQDTGVLRDFSDVEMVLEGMFNVMCMENWRDDSRIQLVMIPFDQYMEIMRNNLLLDSASRKKYLQGINQDTTAREALMAILETAIEKLNCSDVHLEPDPNTPVVESRKLHLGGQVVKNEGRIRYRKEGVLLTGEYIITEDLIKRLVALIKNDANLNIAEHRLPQDGRMSFTAEQIAEYPFLKGYDLRVSIMPTIHGEKAVMRLQNSNSSVTYLSDLGLPPEIQAPLERRINEPHGLILVTGPTGSGKTTTLYACIRELNDGRRNITTIENPVEIQIGGVTQSEVKESIGFDFASCLRSILRQDPDVILVGEIRDEETATTALHAAITGHMVFSTLHVDEAIEALPRLRGLGVSSLEISSGLKAVMAQRLIRNLCPHCFRILPNGRDIINAALGGCRSLDWNFCVRGASDNGCQHCNFTGYSGRNILPELWLVQAEERDLIDKGEDSIRTYFEAAIRKGFVPMSYRAIWSVIFGRTSMDEILRAAVTGDQLLRSSKLIAEAIDANRERISNKIAFTAEAGNGQSEPTDEEKKA